MSLRTMRRQQVLDRALDMANEAVTWAATDAYTAMAFAEIGSLFVELYDRMDKDPIPLPRPASGTTEFPVGPDDGHRMAV